MKRITDDNDATIETVIDYIIIAVVLTVVALTIAAVGNAIVRSTQSL